MNNLLHNKVILVIGGKGLLGEQFVKTIAENGGISISADSGYPLDHGMMEAEGVQMVHVDITKKEIIDKLIAMIVKKYSRLDAVVNTAYPRNRKYGTRFPFVEYSDFCENVSLHLGGYFLVIQRVAEYFKQQKGGNIVNIASIYGCVPPRFEIYNGTEMTMPVEYAVIKSGLLLLTKYVAKYYKNCGIRINCISPGGIKDTQPEIFINQYKQQCLNKGMLDKTDINGTLLFLLSDLSSFINGQNIIVDDGFTL